MRTVKKLEQYEYTEEVFKNLVRNSGPYKTQFPYMSYYEHAEIRGVSLKVSSTEMKYIHVGDIKIIYGQYFIVTEWRGYYIKLTPISKLSELLIRLFEKEIK